MSSNLTITGEFMLSGKLAHRRSLAVVPLILLVTVLLSVPALAAVMSQSRSDGHADPRHRQPCAAKSGANLKVSIDTPVPSAAIDLAKTPSFEIAGRLHGP